MEKLLKKILAELKNNNSQLKDIKELLTKHDDAEDEEPGEINDYKTL